MTQTFRDRIRDLSPPWLQRFWGSRLIYSIAIQWDALIDGTAMGLRSGWPDYTTFDGLPLIGRERGILRGPYEPAVSYAARLKRWRTDRRVRGNPYALMRQVQGYLTGHSVRLRVVNQAGDWHTLNADGTTEHVRSSPRNWDWDGDDAAWSRWWLIIYPPASLWVAAPRYAAAGNTYGKVDSTWGTTATRAEVDSVRAIVQAWNPPGARCVNVIIAFDAASFDPALGPGAGYPAGDWGNWSTTSGGVRVKSRLSTARYWRGSA